MRTAPPEIKDQTTLFAREQKIKKERWERMRPRYAVSQQDTELSVTGEEYLRTPEGEIKVFSTEEQAKAHLRRLGYTRSELEEALETETIKIGALL